MSAKAVSIQERAAPRAGSMDVFAALINATATWSEIPVAPFQDLDWPTLVQSAEYHGVLPIVCERVLESTVASSLAPEVGSDLRRRFQANLVRALPLESEVIRVVEEFERTGVPIIPYKGPVMAEHLWGNSALRVCDDLDFLVEKRNVERAGELLGRLGYRRVSPVASHLRAALLRNASEEQFQHRETGLLLELQWSPAPSVLAVRCNTERVWRRAVSRPLNGRAVLEPSPEDLLVLLSIHGWKHNWSRLIWVGDIAHLLHAHGLDWDRVYAECREQRNVRLLSLALRMVHRVYALTVPKPFAFRDAGLDRLVVELVERMTAMNPCVYRDWHRCMLAARDSRVDGAKQMASFFLTPGLADYGACRLPGWASGGYRAVRLARLVTNAGAKSRE